MNDQRFVIDLEGEGQAVIESGDRPWLEDKLRREPGSTRLRLRADDYDVEGHRRTLSVRVIADDGDDTEGHALSLHFPTTAEADAFRKRLMLTGVIVGSVALGAATGAGLASLQSDTGASTVSSAAAADADRDVGLMDFGGAAAGTAAAGTMTDADRDVGLMDFGGTPAADAADGDEISGGPSIGGPTPR